MKKVQYQQRKKKVGDFRSMNSDQYERILELFLRTTKSGHRDKFRCYHTCRFTTKVDHQTTSKYMPDLRSCLIIDLGRRTDGKNEICVGVRFALCVQYVYPYPHDRYFIGTASQKC